ncbi:HCLS1-binding protein 3 isoform X2 [Elephas maximus indicus]|uniref:HCLS1-binding protein 3 isoform X2 n=1 Tax=Elephas maximus indicus TaxID=99487 RepID=UPI0021160563|nr:HCLS1-binding protein 3 isoform X2 [Elephas maximus indicus]
MQSPAVLVTSSCKVTSSTFLYCIHTAPTQSLCQGASLLHKECLTQVLQSELPCDFRRVQNAHTGLDLTVPQHQEVRGKMMSGHVEYQILVVSRLAAFKSAKHKPEDVVQFLVSKKYSEIEEFYQKLSSRYSMASLPPLPRKVLFVGESDIQERRAVFDEILRCISKDAELAGSPELLEFLGTRSPGAVDLCSRDVSILDADSPAGDDGEAFDFFRQQDGVAGEGLKGKDAGKPLEEEEEEEEVALDPLGIMRSKKPKKHLEVVTKPKPAPRLTIFDEEVDPDEGLFGSGRKLSPQSPVEDMSPRDPLKLFDDPDLGGAVSLGDPLLLPSAHESGQPTSSLGHRKASEELFRVEEDLDQILNLGAEPKPKPLPKPKPPVAAKPALPRKPALPPKVGPSEAVVGQWKQQQQIQAMDEMDILQYIQDHDTPGQATPSLF